MTRWFLSLLLIVLVACGGEESGAESDPERGESAQSGEESNDDALDDDAPDDDALDDDALDDDALDEEFDDDAPTELQVDADGLLLDDSTRDRVAPEQRGIAHILIRYRGAERADDERRSKSAAEALAHEALRLVQSDDFGAVASEMSDDTANKDHGGEMGLLGPGLLPEALDDALFSMEIGEVRGPIESPLGFHILRRTE